jgi:hypothetical protein
MTPVAAAPARGRANGRYLGLIYSLQLGLSCHVKIGSRSE